MEGMIQRQDLEDLSNILSYFFVQRELKKPVTKLRQVINDLRLKVINIILVYFYPLETRLEESLLIDEVIYFLYEIKEDVTDEADEYYYEYCIEKILCAFDIALDIKKRATEDNIRKKMLHDSSILKDFDLNLRPFFKLIKSDREKRLDAYNLIRKN